MNALSQAFAYSGTAVTLWIWNQMDSKRKSQSNPSAVRVHFVAFVLFHYQVSQHKTWSIMTYVDPMNADQRSSTPHRDSPAPLCGSYTAGSRTWLESWMEWTYPTPHCTVQRIPIAGIEIAITTLRYCQTKNQDKWEVHFEKWRI